MKSLECFGCTDITDDYFKNKEICGKCRKVLKIDIVMKVLEMDPVYLSEKNRNKKGRPSSITGTMKEDIVNDMYYRNMSFGEIAKKRNISKGSVSNIIYQYKKSLIKK